MAGIKIRLMSPETSVEVEKEPEQQTSQLSYPYLAFLVIGSMQPTMEKTSRP